MDDLVYRERERLIQAIYDGADDARGFHDVLERIGSVLGASFGHTLAIPLGTKLKLSENHSFGYDESSFAEYDRDWRDKDPRFAAAAARPGQLLCDMMVVDSPTFERSPFYNEHLARTGARYTLFGIFQASADLVAATAFMRSKRDGEFGAEELAGFAMLAPHLVRAVRLRHIVQSLRADIDDLRRALDCVTAAVAILDRAGKVLCANAAAEDLFGRRDGLHTAKGTLSASSPTEASALLAAIAQSAKIADARMWEPTPAELAPCVTVSRKGGVPVAVTFLPLRPRNVVREDSQAARVLAIFHDPQQLVRIDPEVAAKLHGLTATEAALAASLAEGRSLAEFAHARGCTEQTARTHLKRLLEKTRTHRQADLVRVLLTGAAMHQVR